MILVWRRWSQQYAALIKPILNLANFCFVNLLREVWQTWKKSGGLNLFIIYQTFTSWPYLVQTVHQTVLKLCSGSKMLCSTYSGNYCSIWQTLCLIGGNLRALMWKRKKKLGQWLSWCFEPSQHLGLISALKLGQQNMHDGMSSFSFFGGNGLILGLVGGAALSVGPSR